MRGLIQGKVLANYLRFISADYLIVRVKPEGLEFNTIDIRNDPPIADRFTIRKEEWLTYETVGSDTDFDRHNVVHKVGIDDIEHELGYFTGNIFSVEITKKRMEITELDPIKRTGGLSWLNYGQAAN